MLISTEEERFEKVFDADSKFGESRDSLILQDISTEDELVLLPVEQVSVCVTSEIDYILLPKQFFYFQCVFSHEF